MSTLSSIHSRFSFLCRRERPSACPECSSNDLGAGIANVYVQANGKDGQILIAISMLLWCRISLTCVQELRTRSPLKMPLATNGRVFFDVSEPETDLNQAYP